METEHNTMHLLGKCFALYPQSSFLLFILRQGLTKFVKSGLPLNLGSSCLVPFSTGIIDLSHQTWMKALFNKYCNLSFWEKANIIHMQV